MESLVLLLFLLLLTVFLLDLSFMGFMAKAENPTTDDEAAAEACMETEELLGLFEVMGALLEDTYWTQMHPHPCTDTPWPGIQCGIDQKNPQIFHVTKLHIGPDISNPSCKTSANLSESLLKLPYLKTLSIFSCFLSSGTSLNPALFGSFSSLEQIVIKSNPALTGEIPQTLPEIATLKVLCLSQNSLQGGIPKEIGRLVDLEQLDLSYNHLTGEVPQEIGQLTSLTILDLSYNNFQGQVPYSLGHLVSVQKIDLSFNSFAETVPKELGNLKNLVLLDLSHNYLKGPLPDTLFSGLKGLQYFLLDDNPINTRLPTSFGTLGNLRVLSLSGCGFLGPVPTSFGSNLGHLRALSLDRNKLIGTVPSNLGALPNLGQLNLSQNQLSGELFFTDDVIQRLGKRLDVRGNSGLCRRSHQFVNCKNTSDDQFLEIPVCNLGSSSSSSSSQSSGDDQFERMKPTWADGEESSISQLNQLDRLMLFWCFCCNLFVILI